MKKIFFLCILFFVLLYAGYSSVWRIAFSQPNENSRRVSIQITIEQGWSVTRISQELYTHGLIFSVWEYRAYGFFNDAVRLSKPGSYTFHFGDSYATLARVLAGGPERSELDVLIVEGESNADIFSRFDSLGVPHPDMTVDFWKTEFPFLKSVGARIQPTSIEGYIFPSTYRVYADDMPNAVIRKALREFEKRYPALQKTAEEQGRSVQDIVTLASIVEREVANPADRKIVAGIFWNRLKSGMPLQSDATVNYITHAGRTRPTYDDLARESLYNTYKYAGLPPGPINNPGDDALAAALHPAATEYFYFLTDPAGKTYFGKTLQEHNRNRQKL